MVTDNGRTAAIVALLPSHGNVLIFNPGRNGCWASSPLRNTHDFLPSGLNGFYWINAGDERLTGERGDVSFTYNDILANTLVAAPGVTTRIRILDENYGLTPYWITPRETNESLNSLLLRAERALPRNDDHEEEEEEEEENRKLIHLTATNLCAE